MQVTAQLLKQLRTQKSSKGFRVQGDCFGSMRSSEGRKAERTRKDQIVIASATGVSDVVNVAWLNAASETYQISPDPRDYVIAEIPIVTVDFPNRNMQAFPYEEVTYFDPTYGKLIYQTFVGKPTHQDHDNQDPLKAKGIIFDAALKYVKAYNVWKICALAGFCRQKDPALANGVLDGSHNKFSMGALVQDFICTLCGNLTTNSKLCRCDKAGIAKGQRDSSGFLRYLLCIGANYVELSDVGDPADVTADIPMDSVW